MQVPLADVKFVLRVVCNRPESRAPMRRPAAATLSTKSSHTPLTPSATTLSEEYAPVLFSFGGQHLAARMDLRDQFASRHSQLHATPPAARQAAVGNCRRGNAMVIVVPSPGADSTSTKPPTWRTTPYTWARPRPVPAPSALVVK